MMLAKKAFNKSPGIKGINPRRIIFEKE